ncbi:MAG: hypothetical protein PUP46_03735 [Endozoicomonas sp. (ex Botrylloides leachii)]|nr:hypothetical protein [Endozoicomonas sp. (ex Botrylloides leachii)]
MLMFSGLEVNPINAIMQKKKFHTIDSGQLFYLRNNEDIKQYSIETKQTESLKALYGYHSQYEAMYIKKSDVHRTKIVPTDCPSQIALVDTLKIGSTSFQLATVIFLLNSQPVVPWGKDAGDTDNPSIVKTINHAEVSNSEVSCHRAIADWIEKNNCNGRKELVSHLFSIRGIGWTCAAYAFIGPPEDQQSHSSDGYQAALADIEKETGYSEQKIIEHMSGRVLKIFKCEAATEESAKYILKEYECTSRFHFAVGVPLFASYTSYFHTNAVDFNNEIKFFSVQEDIAPGRFIHELIKGETKEAKEVIDQCTKDGIKEMKEFIFNSVCEIIDNFSNYKKFVVNDNIKLGFDSNWKNLALDLDNVVKVVDYSPPELEYNGERTHCYMIFNGDSQKSDAQYEMELTMPWAMIVKNVYHTVGQLCYFIALVFMDGGEADDYIKEDENVRDDNQWYIKSFANFIKKYPDLKGLESESKTKCAIEIALKNETISKDISTKFRNLSEQSKSALLNISFTCGENDGKGFPYHEYFNDISKVICSANKVDFFQRSTSFVTYRKEEESNNLHRPRSVSDGAHLKKPSSRREKYTHYLLAVIGGMIGKITEMRLQRTSSAVEDMAVGLNGSHETKKLVGN